VKPDSEYITRRNQTSEKHSVSYLRITNVTNNLMFPCSGIEMARLHCFFVL